MSVMANIQSDTKTVENEERSIPPEVMEFLDTSREEWREEVEWEQQLQELEKLPEQEQEVADQIEQLIAEGLANELDDAEVLLEALDSLRELESDRAEKIAEHHDERNWSQRIVKED